MNIKNTIKKVLFVVIIVTLINACNSDTTSGKEFTVEGKITNPPADSIYLQLLPYTEGMPSTLDSVKIDEDGSYKLNAKASEEGLYILSFQNEPALIVVNDAKNITANFNAKDYRNPMFEGSDATTKLYGFIHDYWQQDSLLSVIKFRLDTISAGNLKDSLIDTLQKQAGYQLSSLGNIIRNFIQQSKSPASICFALDKTREILPADDVTKLVTDASQRFPTHSGLTLFKNMVTKTTDAPNLTMEAPDGKKISISDFKGKYLLVDFWASWCGPCRQENPNVVNAYEQYKGKNFEILGVSLDKDKDAWQLAIATDKLSWPQMSDLKYWESDAVSAYQIEGIPFNVLLDPKGKVIATNLRGPLLQAKLKEVLK